MSLSPDQIAQFKRDGYLIAPDVLTAADLQPIIDEINDWVAARAAKYLAEGKISDAAEQLPFDRRLAALYQQAPQIAGGNDIMQTKSRAIFEFFFNQNLLDAIECLIGPELTCNPIQHLRAKMPAKKTSEGYTLMGDVPWHQDVGVTWESADNSDIITCWIPLIDACAENGCMKIIPGIDTYLEHQKEGGTMVRPELMPETEPIVAACPKGGIVFMNKFCPHMGMTNRSEQIRWTLDLRFQPTGQPTGRPFWPDFVVRTAQPDAALIDYDEWCSRWDYSLKTFAKVAWHRTVPKEQRIPPELAHLVPAE